MNFGKRGPSGPSGRGPSGPAGRGPRTSGKDGGCGIAVAFALLIVAVLAAWLA